MEASEILGVLAGGFGVVMAASPIPQVRRVHLMRRFEDVSVPVSGDLLGRDSALAGVRNLVGNAAIIVANAVGVVCGAVTISVVLYWRRRGE